MFYIIINVEIRILLLTYLNVYFCVETSIKQSRGGTFPSPIPLPFETNVAIEVVIIGWKKICFGFELDGYNLGFEMPNKRFGKSSE